jgi:transposase
MGQYEKVTRVGLDVHRNFSLASLQDDRGQVIARQRLEHADRQELRRRIGAWPAGTPVVLEATFGWGWMCDELLEMKMAPHLASSRKSAAFREAQGLAKSNKIDADLMARLYSEKPAMKQGVEQRWWEVWLAPPSVQDQRELLRHRASLVKTQTALKNRIHATLHRHGILCPYSDLFGKAGLAFLSLLLVDYDPPLREAARQTLASDLKLLDQLRSLIARATHQFRRELRRDESGQRLLSIPGISSVLAYTIVAEIGSIDRFRSGRSLLQYSLLAPQSADSGEDRPGKPMGRHLGRAGNHTLQWAFIQAAHGAVRKDQYLRSVFNRRTNNGKEDRGRGYITVANHLCRIAYAMWKNQMQYQPVPPPRPGSKQAREQNTVEQNKLKRTQAPRQTLAKNSKRENSIKKSPTTKEFKRQAVILRNKVDERVSSGNGPALGPYGHSPQAIEA